MARDGGGLRRLPNTGAGRSSSSCPLAPSPLPPSAPTESTAAAVPGRIRALVGRIQHGGARPPFAAAMGAPGLPPRWVTLAAMPGPLDGYP
jgi:hypothetical protein